MQRSLMVPILAVSLLAVLAVISIRHRMSNVPLFPHQTQQHDRKHRDCPYRSSCTFPFPSVSQNTLNPHPLTPLREFKTSLVAPIGVELYPPHTPSPTLALREI